MADHDQPKGTLILRTLAMPADTNANGDIFGGWILSQMDIAGAILAKEVADGKVSKATLTIQNKSLTEKQATLEKQLDDLK